MWADVPRGSVSQAREFFSRLDQADQAKVLALFKRLADTGKIYNREKFRSLGENYGPIGRSLFEFKSFQIRFIGAFRGGCRFVIARGIQKKKDRHDKSELEIAQKILVEYDALNSVKEGGKGKL